MIIQTALAKALSDLWEEILYLVMFNLFCVIAAIIVLPFPFALFALFAVVYDISKGKVVRISSFFNHIKHTWPQAITWWIVNCGIYFLLGASLLFYEQYGTAQWAVFLRLVTVGLGMLWGLIQLLTLAIYPRLVKPGYKIALHNSVAIIGLSPVNVLLLALISGVILLFTIIVTPLLLFVPFAVIAVFTNRIVEVVVSQHLPKSKAES